MGDFRYRNRDKLDLQKLKSQFPANFVKKIDISKVNLEYVSRWTAARLLKELDFEDDVLENLVENLLQEHYTDPKQIQLQLTPFLGKATPTFMEDLWNLLLQCQVSKTGIPDQILAAKIAQLSSQQSAGGGLDRTSKGDEATTELPKTRKSRWDQGTSVKSPGVDEASIQASAVTAAPKPNDNNRTQYNKGRTSHRARSRGKSPNTRYDRRRETSSHRRGRSSHHRDERRRRTNSTRSRSKQRRKHNRRDRDRHSRKQYSSDDDDSGEDSDARRRRRRAARQQRATRSDSEPSLRRSNSRS